MNYELPHPSENKVCLLPHDAYLDFDKGTVLDHTLVWCALGCVRRQLKVVEHGLLHDLENVETRRTNGDCRVRHMKERSEN